MEAEYIIIVTHQGKAIRFCERMCGRLAGPAWGKAITLDEGDFA